MLLRHHETLQSLEYKHLTAIHRLRDDQMHRQHSTELANQKEYTLRTENELRKKHAMELKQQPKCLRVSHTIVWTKFSLDTKTKNMNFLRNKTKKN